MKEKKDPPKKTTPGPNRKPPASLYLWLLAFLVLGSLIVFNSSPYFAASEEWSANYFLAQLEDGAVVTAEIMPESDKILAISGEFRDNRIGEACSFYEQALHGTPERLVPYGSKGIHRKAHHFPRLRVPS